MTLRGAFRLAVPLVLGALVLAACGGDDDSTSGAGGTTTVAPSDGSSTTAGSATLTVDVKMTSLGNTLVDANGMTLYAFKPDTNGKSTCNKGCDETWPPLTPTGQLTLASGLDAEDFKVITRDDGSKQVTDYGQPLYTYSGDKQPGDTNGDGIGGVWYAVGTDGKAVKSAGTTATSTPDTTAAAPGY
jgi:predicted lipoprotein with Yx(FWY)xxD motif